MLANIIMEVIVLYNKALRRRRTAIIKAQEKNGSLHQLYQRLWAVIYYLALPMDIFIEKPSYVHCMEFEAHRESIIDLIMSLHVSLCFMNVSLTDK